MDIRSLIPQKLRAIARKERGADVVSKARTWG